MVVEALDEVMASVKALPVPAVLADLATYQIVAANDAAKALYEPRVNNLVGSAVTSYVRPEERPRLEAACLAMVEHAVDGYQVRRCIVLPDGREVPFNIFGRRVDSGHKVYGLWLLVEDTGPSPMIELSQPPPVVLVLTDHDWQIAYMSADADLLGEQGSDLRGFPLLGLVHPSVGSKFLEAAGRAASGRVAVTVATRMRVGRDSWADRRCLIVRMCEHHPPRLGLVITAGSSRVADDFSTRVDEDLRRCQLEAKASHALEALPALALLPHGSELSTRQTEIVAHLIAGQSVPDIAHLMFLSPSTVRNHLAVIYRKFAVHSQAELLAALLRASTSHHS